MKCARIKIISLKTFKNSKCVELIATLKMIKPTMEANNQLGTLTALLHTQSTSSTTNLMEGMKVVCNNRWLMMEMQKQLKMMMTTLVELLMFMLGMKIKNINILLFQRIERETQRLSMLLLLTRNLLLLNDMLNSCLMANSFILNRKLKN